MNGNIISYNYYFLLWFLNYQNQNITITRKLIKTKLSNYVLMLKLI